MQSLLGRSSGLLDDRKDKNGSARDWDYCRNNPVTGKNQTHHQVTETTSAQLLVRLRDQTSQAAERRIMYDTRFIIMSLGHHGTNATESAGVSEH